MESSVFCMPISWFQSVFEPQTSIYLVQQPENWKIFFSNLFLGSFKAGGQFIYFFMFALFI